MSSYRTALHVIVHAVIFSSQSAFALGTCIPGREEEVVACDQLSTVASWEGPRHNSAICTYNPPTGWVIVDHRVIVNSSNNGSREVSTLAQGLKLISESDLRAAYDQLSKVAGEYADPQTGQNARYSGQISDRFQQHLRELRQYQTNRNTIQAVVRAAAHGSYFDRKRGWENITVHARLRCLGKPGVDKLISQVAESIGMKTGSKFHISNECDRPLKIAIGYMQLSGRWNYRGWWTYQPGEKSYPTSNDMYLISNNRVFYMYAETLDGSIVWKGNHNKPAKGNSEDVRPFTEISLSKDNTPKWPLIITCKHN